MNSTLQKTTIGLILSMIFATSLHGQNLKQPATLEATIIPTGYCDGVGESCNCSENCCCKPTCCPQRVVEEVEKKCWKVKTKVVCIPRFRWPWECFGDSKCDCAADSCCGESGFCGGPPKCGKVRCVNVLEQHKFTCKECGIEWQVRCVRTGNRCSCEGNGCCPGCGCSAETPSINALPLTSALVIKPIRQVSATESQPTGRPDAKRFPLWQKKIAASLAEEL